MLRRLTFFCNILLRMSFLEGGSVSLIKEICRSILDYGQKKVIDQQWYQIRFCTSMTFLQSNPVCCEWSCYESGRSRQKQSGSEPGTADLTLHLFVCFCFLVFISLARYRPSSVERFLCIQISRGWLCYESVRSRQRLRAALNVEQLIQRWRPKLVWAAC